MKIPPLALSHGQVAWAINFGQAPPRAMLNQLNYLRQRGIPRGQGARSAPGSGNRLTYSYTDLVECGVALTAFQRGMKFVDLEKVFVKHRRLMHRAYRQALQDLPELAIEASWVKSRGREIPILGEEILLRLHDRHSERPGHVELLEVSVDPIGEAFERLRQTEPNAALVTQRVLRLTCLALQWTAWALEAPAIRPGPKTVRSSTTP